MAIITKTIRPSGGDYDSLSGWNAGEQTDLVAADDNHVAECYIFSGGLVDEVIIDGWVTDATHRIHVKAASGQEHDGTPKTGFYVTKSRSWGAIIRIIQNYTDLTALDVENTGSSGYGIHNNQLNSPNFGIINRCISGVTQPNARAYYFQKTGEIRNSLAYGQRGEGIIADSFATATALNCTVVNLDDGLKSPGGGTPLVAKNVVAYDCQNNYTGTFSANSTNNATSSATDDAPGPNSVLNVADTDFADAANNDFHLSGASSKLFEAGVDLSLDFTDDIDGDTRIVPWDIGADEFVSGPPPAIEGTGTLEAQSAAVVGVGEVIPAIIGTGALQAQNASVIGVGDVEGTASGTGVLQAQNATVLGIGDVVSPKVGTGTLQAQSAQVSGVGAVVHAGSGALQAQSAAVVGVGEVGNVRTGTGALQAGEAVVVGTGIRVSVGSGALQAQDAAVAGAGVVEGLTSGTGALQAQEAAVAGTGHLIRVGSGALQAQAAQVAGVGAILGELTLSPADIAAIADAVYAKFVSEGLVQQINEVWQRRGLDPANPQTYDKAGNEIRVGNITIDLSGDPSSVTQTRQP